MNDVECLSALLVSLRGSVLLAILRVMLMISSFVMGEKWMSGQLL